MIENVNRRILNHGDEMDYKQQKNGTIRYCSRFTVDGEFKENVIIYNYKILDIEDRGD